MKHTSISMIAALCLSVPAVAFAEQGKPCPLQEKKACDGQYKKHHNIEAMDANSDNKVSWAEFQNANQVYMKNKFEHMDANGDGFISKEDKKARHEKRSASFFEQADSNHDGVLSKEEHLAAKKYHERESNHNKQ